MSRGEGRSVRGSEEVGEGRKVRGCEVGGEESKRM